MMNPVQMGSEDMVSGNVCWMGGVEATKNVQTYLVWGRFNFEWMIAFMFLGNGACSWGAEFG